jgi:hypothetical protein
LYSLLGKSDHLQILPGHLCPIAHEVATEAIPSHEPVCALIIEADHPDAVPVFQVASPFSLVETDAKASTAVES